jgi:hypothetical protein
MALEEQYHIKENSWLAKLAAMKLRSDKMAIVVGSTIHLYNASKEDLLKDEHWMKHELCHVRQYRKYGVMRFLLLYLWESLLKGYRKNRFEEEARKAASL